MNIEWLGPPPGSNFLPGRSGNPVSLIVCHWMAGSFDAALARFRNPASVVSAHFLVSTTGRIAQVVSTDDTAYHAGDWDTNLLSIGIEHEAGPLLLPSDALYAASAELHRFLADKFHIVLEPNVTVLRHQQIVPTQCPGTLDIERIVREAKGDDMDRATFDQWFRENYEQYGVAKLFDDLKTIEDKQAHHKHTGTASTLVQTGEPQ